MHYKCHLSLVHKRRYTLCTLKHLKIPFFFKTNYYDFVTLCHGFCISYDLAHVLSNFQGPHIKSINTAIFWLLVPLHYVLYKVKTSASVFFQISQFFRSLGRIHTNRFINLLLWYEYHCVLRSKQRFLTVFCKRYTVRVQWRKRRKLRLHRGRSTLNVQSSLPPLCRKPLLNLRRKSAFLMKTSEQEYDWFNLLNHDRAFCTECACCSRVGKLGII